MSSPVTLLTPAQSLSGQEIFYAVQKQGGVQTDVQVTAGQIASLVEVAGARTQLTANTNFYVSTTGSNSNNGLSLATAWATLQHADDVISKAIDLNGWDATVNISPGSYVGVENLTGYFTSTGTRNGALGNVTCQVNYIGNTVTPSNVKITPTAFRSIGFGQFAPNAGALTGVTLNGLDFVETLDSAVWFDNFYVGVFALGSVGVNNCQFDGAGQTVPLMAGNISTGGNILINGSAAGWIGSQCTAIMSDGNESATNAVMFQEANITISGNPTINNLIDQSLVSECLMAGAGQFTGAYTGNPFRTQAHSLLTASFLDWNNAKFGTPTGKPPILMGGLFRSTGTLGYEATGGQVLGTNKNYSQPVTGFTLNLGRFDGIVIIDPSGTLATGTITMPSPVLDQQRVNIRSSQIITTLTINSGGSETLKGAPTTIAAGGTIDAVYQDSNTTWYF